MTEEPHETDSELPPIIDELLRRTNSLANACIVLRDVVCAPDFPAEHHRDVVGFLDGYGAEMGLVESAMLRRATDLLKMRHKMEGT